MILNVREEPAEYKAPLPPIGSRQLGSDRDGECLPDNWPQTLPERVWEEVRQCPVSSLAILLSPDGRSGWLACKPDHRSGPILIHRLPVAGRLNHQTGGLCGHEPLLKDFPMAQEPPDDGKHYNY